MNSFMSFSDLMSLVHSVTSDRPVEGCANSLGEACVHLARWRATRDCEITCVQLIYLDIPSPGLRQRLVGQQFLKPPFYGVTQALANRRCESVEHKFFDMDFD